MVEETTTASADLIEPGIYFNLDSATYHRDSSLGSTSLKEIEKDPVDFQYDRVIGDEDEEEKREKNVSLIWGSALHSRTLEGSAAFARDFVVAPDKRGHPKALFTMDDMRRHAGSMGLKGGKTKAEVGASIRDHDKNIEIWDETMARFEASAVGKTIIKPRVAAQIEQAAEWMQENDKLAGLMSGGTLTAGSSEVSIFYEEDGVRLKCRLDHLMSHAILDLKSFRAPPGWTTNPIALPRIIGRVVAAQRYDLQCAAYMRGWLKAKELFAAGRIFGANEKDMATLKAAMSKAALKWIWVLVKNFKSPQSFVGEFDLGSFASTGAGVSITDAIQTYRENTAKFGEGKLWKPCHDAFLIGDSELPAYLGL